MTIDPSTTPRKSDGVNVPSGRVKALDELLDLPHLNVLFRDILTHDGRRRMRFLDAPETTPDVCFVGEGDTDQVRQNEASRFSLFAFDMVDPFVDTIQVTTLTKSLT